MEISKVCNVAGDWPTRSPGGITGPIWLQILTLNPQKEGGKKGNVGLSVSLVAVERR